MRQFELKHVHAHLCKLATTRIGQVDLQTVGQTQASVFRWERGPTWRARMSLMTSGSEWGSASTFEMTGMRGVTTLVPANASLHIYTAHSGMTCLRLYLGEPFCVDIVSRHASRIGVKKPGPCREGQSSIEGWTTPPRSRKFRLAQRRQDKAKMSQASCQ